LTNEKSGRILSAQKRENGFVKTKKSLCLKKTAGLDFVMRPPEIRAGQKK